MTLKQIVKSCLYKHETFNIYEDFTIEPTCCSIKTTIWLKGKAA